MTQNMIKGFKDTIKKGILQPSSNHFPAVYWFWEHIPAEDEITRQLAQIRQAGYRTFLIQPRLSFPIKDYLCPAYLMAYKKALEIAEYLGLKAGLYDDYNWISGHAGGRTVEGHPHLRERQLFWSECCPTSLTFECSISQIHPRLVEGLGEAAARWVYEGGVPFWADWQIYKVFACPPVSRESGLPGYKDISELCQISLANEHGCCISGLLPEPLPPDWKVYAFVSARCSTSRLINYLLPEAAQRFIEVGYEPYRRILQEFFGKTLTFLFIDQPYAGFYSWKEQSSGPLSSLMFTPHLADIFQQERAYPLAEALLGLVLPENRDTPRLRCDFFDTYGRLARRSFLAPTSAWAAAQGLEFSGHELLSFVGSWSFTEGLPMFDSRCNFGADYFAIDEYKTLSAVDACNYHPQISARFGASTAKAHGRRGCKIEQYSVPVGRGRPAPAGQWDLTLEQLRTQAVRHLFWGANQYIFHAFYQSKGTETPDLLENMRFDFPPGINYEPWFKHHPAFAEELARLNAFLAEGETDCRTGVFYPLHTFWAEGPAHAFTRESAFWNRWLSENGVEFDFLDENHLLDKTTDPAALLRNYQVLVLPGMSVLGSPKLLDLLEDWLEQGGLLLASGPLPAASQLNGRDKNLAARVEKLFSQNLRAFPLNGSETEKGEKLGFLLKQYLQEAVRIETPQGKTGGVWSWKGKKDGLPLLALINDSPQDKTLQINLPDKKYLPNILHPSDGRFESWAFYEWAEAGTRVHLPLEAGEPLCLQFEPAEKELPHLCHLKGDCRIKTCRTESGQFIIEVITYTAEAVELEISSSARPQIKGSAVQQDVRPLSSGRWLVCLHPADFPAEISLSQNWLFSPAGSCLHQKTDIRKGWEKQIFPAFSGTGFYETVFVLKEEEYGFLWSIHFKEIKNSAEIWLNDQKILQKGWPPFDLELPVSLLKPERNSLRVAVSSTAGNSFYCNTPFAAEQLAPCGIIGAPVLRPFVQVKIIA